MNVPAYFCSIGEFRKCWLTYTELENEFASHKIVDHGHDEYVNGDAHTNTLEG